MNIYPGLSRYLLNRTRREFKNELCYLNTAGLLYWLRIKLPWVETVSSLKGVNLAYLNDLESLVKRHPERERVALCNIKSPEMHFVDHAARLLEKAGFDRSGRGAAIDWLLFQALLEGGFLDLEPDMRQIDDDGAPMNDRMMHDHDLGDGYVAEGDVNYHSGMDVEGVMNLTGGNVLDGYANEPHIHLE